MATLFCPLTLTARSSATNDFTCAHDQSRVRTSSAVLHRSPGASPRRDTGAVAASVIDVDLAREAGEVLGDPSVDVEELAHAKRMNVTAQVCVGFVALTEPRWSRSSPPAKTVAGGPGRVGRPGSSVVLAARAIAVRGRSSRPVPRRRPSSADAARPVRASGWHGAVARRSRRAPRISLGRSRVRGRRPSTGPGPRPVPDGTGGARLVPVESRLPGRLPQDLG